MTKPTLTEALAAKGITHERDENTSNTYAHVLKRDGVVLGSYRAMAAWEALKRGDFDKGAPAKWTPETARQRVGGTYGS